MKNLLSALLLLLCSLRLVAADTTINIIPIPVSMTVMPGSYLLGNNITLSSNPENSFVATYLERIIETSTGKQVTFHTAPGGDISFNLLQTNDPKLGKEGYKLSVTNSGISIHANAPAGIFYGVQSLLQILPPEIMAKEVQQNVDWKVPLVEVTDYPRFGWRGLMLDVSRHFFTVAEVKQYIDAMVKYKYNLLHWGLTNDEGWRIEIKSLPNLTKKGAWNVKKVGRFSTFSKPGPDEPRDYGGFYTQEEIRDVVAYAAQRFVNVMPEINMPGHSLAIIASYPELSCTPGADKYEVSSGEPFMDWSRGAPPIALVDNTLCPANEKVYPFVDKVLTEVAQLFPFEYIHLGGDEAPFNFWEKSPQIKALMAREKLKTMPQVQAYFEKRVEKIVQSKGKKMIGWDEILEGGVNKSTAIMSWRGEKHGIEASAQGHKVVMTPTTFAYLDYMQGDVATEPRVYASLRLNKTYQFDPLPKGADPKNILGGQGNLWTEQIFNFRQAEYMTWPRGMAIAESLWSPPEKKNWNNFIERVENNFERLDYTETKYSPALYDPIVTVSKKGSKYYITLTPEIANLDFHYSFDYSMPDKFYPRYEAPLEIPVDAGLFRVISYRDNKEIGRMVSIRVDDLKERAK